MTTSLNTLFLLNASSTVWRAMEEFHFRLAKRLCDEGAQVVIVLAGPVPVEISSRLESSGASVRILAYRDRLAFLIGLRRLIRDHSISTVHIRFFRMNQFINWAVRAAGAKTIIYTDAESNETYARGFRLVLKRFRTRIVTYPVTRMVAISNFVKERLKQGGVNSFKLTVIHNGIDLSRFAPIPDAKSRLGEALNEDLQQLFLVSIARFVDVKRVDVLLRTCALLKSRGVSFRLLLAGQGGPLEAALRDLSSKLDLDGSVIWHGPTDQPELLLSAADLFLFASQGEAFGNVLVESLSCGTPVVAVDSGAASEIVVDGECGQLVPKDDVQAFATAIETLANAPELRARMSSAARIRSRSFDVDNAVQKTLGLYQEVASR